MSDLAVPLAIPERLLAGAGPSNVPARVMRGLSRPTIGHLDPIFLDVADRTNSRLRSVFGTANPATFPVSGTGTAGMETMLVNFLEPGDRLVVGVCGTFGERIVDAAGRLGIATIPVVAPPGRPVDLDELGAAMSHGADALAIVHGETSTGVAQPLEGLGELARDREALLLVDCVTSLGGHPLAVDDLDVDVAFSGTQKCLNCPPGLAPITIGERARDRLRNRRTPVPSWCFDVAAILDYWSSGQRPYHHTPPINSIYGLHESLALILEEGLDRRWARHEAASRALLAGLEPLGFEPFVADEHRLWPLTTVVPPPSLDEASARRRLLDDHGIEVSGGLGTLKGQIWRIGTMGVNASLETLTTLVGAIAGSVDPAGAADALEQARDRWFAGLQDRPAVPSPC
jgi:alanine-glyoxylate transaminase/serine-glyoxylate transaminase/serine-pyruvate transaminase